MKGDITGTYNSELYHASKVRKIIKKTREYEALKLY